MKKLYKREPYLIFTYQKYIKKIFRIGKGTIPWENLLVFQTTQTTVWKQPRRYFKGFDAACWQTAIMVEQKLVWPPQPAALKLSLQDFIFFIRADFAWVRNLGLFSIKALKNEGKNFNQESYLSHSQRILCGLIISVHMLFLFLSGAGELIACLGINSEHMAVEML